MAPVPTEYAATLLDWWEGLNSGHPTRHGVAATSASKSQRTYNGATETASAGIPANTSIPLVTNAAPGVVVPTQTLKSPVSTQSEQQQMDIECDEDDEWLWDKDDEDDCYYDEALVVLEEEEGLELADFPEIVTTAVTVLHEYQRRSELSSETPNATTGDAAFTRHLRPLVTIVPSAVSEITITEAVFIAYTAIADQTSQRPLREAKRSMSIFWPDQDSDNVTSSNHPQRTAAPKAMYRRKSEVTAEVVGSITAVIGFIFVLASVYLFYRCRRKKQEQRRRERREANPVSSRITTAGGR